MCSFDKENNFKPCLTKQLLNMFKLWCERDISLIKILVACLYGSTSVRSKRFCVFRKQRITTRKIELVKRGPLFFQARVPFLERPGNLTGPKSYFAIKFSRKVGCVLTSNEVHFVSLADNFTVQFSNLLKLLSRMKNKTA